MLKNYNGDHLISWKIPYLPEKSEGLKVLFYKIVHKNASTEICSESKTIVFISSSLNLGLITANSMYLLAQCCS